MQTVYVGNTLINDIMLGSQRMDDTLQNTQLKIDYLIVAGGGAGGAAPSSTPPGSGGGGAGGLKSGSLFLNKTGTSYTVRVGRGGNGKTDVQGENGYPSEFNSILTTGGGGGGSQGVYSAPINGLVGGSGGGGGTTGGQGAAGTIGEGNSGSNANGVNICGGGGGAGSAGGTGAFQGGSGSGSLWLDGLEYSIGGCGDGSSYCRQNQGAGYGNGGGGTFSNNVGNAGQNGIVKIRYYGSPVATGGTITTSGSYTYHTFTYSLGVTSSFVY